MATGLTVADDDISVGGRVTPGDNLGRFLKPFSTSETSDVALDTCANGGTQVGSNLTVNIPTAGFLRVTIIEAECDRASGSSYTSISVGIKVGAAAGVFNLCGAQGVLKYFPNGLAQSGAGSNLVIRNGSCGQGDFHYTVTFDIATESFATGSQTVQIMMGDEANASYADPGQLSGTSTTGVFQLEVMDGA